MSLNTNTTSLDTIIRLIKGKTQYKGEIENELLSIEKELTALHDQARSALDGTGLSLVALVNTVEDTNQKPSLEINSWRDLKVGDTIRVKIKGEEEFVVRTIELLEDYSYTEDLPFRVEEELPDGCHWIDISCDKWEFVSRP